MKNKLAALFLFSSICIPLVGWQVGNYLQYPDDHAYWNWVVAVIGIGLFAAVPYAIIRLLRSK